MVTNARASVKVTVDYIQLPDGQFECRLNGGWWVGRGDTKTKALAKARERLIADAERYDALLEGSDET